MQLDTALPLLFGTPSPLDARRGVMQTLFITGLGVLCFLLTSLAPAFPYFLAMTFLSGAHMVVAARRTRFNLLFMFRYFLIWVLIFGTAAVWAAYGGQVKVAPFGAEFQTAENTRILVFAGFLSLSGALLGWLIALRGARDFDHAHFTLSPAQRQLLIVAGITLAVFAGGAYLYVAGGVIGTAGTYGAKAHFVRVPFAVFNVFHFIGIGFLLIGSVSTEGKLRQRWLWLAVITLVMGMLAGSRADYMPQALILLTLIMLVRFRHLYAKVNYRKILVLGAVGLGVVAAAHLLGGFVAAWRVTGDLRDTLHLLSDPGRLGLITHIYGHEMLWLETGNMMLGGLYAAIVNVNEGLTGLLWGRSYANWLLVTPPAFMGLPRPPGLEWETFIAGQRMSQGGVFEVAEAYWNFGLVGCFAVSFAISYFFGILLKKGLQYCNYFFLTWYLVFGFMSLRAIWYQNFSYYRIMTIMLILYGVAWVFARWFVVGRRAGLFVLVQRKKVTNGVSDLPDAAMRTGNILEKGRSEG